MKNKRLALAALILCCAVLFSGCFSTLVPIIDYFIAPNTPSVLPSTPAPAPAVTPPPSAASTPQPEDVNFEDVHYERPDFDAFFKNVEQLATELRAGVNEAELFEKYDKLNSAVKDFQTQYALADIRHAQDIFDEEMSDELEYLSEQFSIVDLKLTELTIAILDSEYGEAARLRWGDGFCDRTVSSARRNNYDLLDEFARLQALCTQYDVVSSSVTVEQDGRTWTMEDILNDEELSYYDYLELYKKFYRQHADDVYPIFYEMFTLRQQIAHDCGYKNYAEYAYDSYQRDYTLEDAQRLHELVKEYVSPLYVDIENEYINDDDSDVMYNALYDLDDALTTIGRCAEDISPELKVVFDSLIHNGFSDIGSSKTRQSGAFSAYLPSLERPFLYFDWAGDVYDVGSLSHELGHCYNMYYHGTSGFNCPDFLDLYEVDSQGLEVLFMKYSDDIYGSDAQSADKIALSSMVYSLVTGCLNDEFQQEVYALDDITPEKLERIYTRLYKEYKMDDIYIGVEGEWSTIPHTFLTPMYYISYAISAVPALELWEVSQRSYSKAYDMYNELHQRDQEVPFLSVLEQCGFSDPFDEDTIKALVKSVRMYYILLDKTAAA